jgi:hypothetical protein
MYLILQNQKKKLMQKDNSFVTSNLKEVCFRLFGGSGSTLPVAHKMKENGWEMKLETMLILISSRG